MKNMLVLHDLLTMTTVSLALISTSCQ